MWALFCESSINANRSCVWVCVSSSPPLPSSSFHHFIDMNSIFQFWFIESDILLLVLWRRASSDELLATFYLLYQILCFVCCFFLKLPHNWLLVSLSLRECCFVVTFCPNLWLVHCWPLFPAIRFKLWFS